MQFRLSTLFLVGFVVATSVALAGGWGIPLAAGALYLIGGVHFVRLGRMTLLELAICFVVFGILVALLLPDQSRPFLSGCDRQCGENLKQIALGLHAYRERHGSFPPSCLVDKDGKPSHSWRVMVLPYLEHKDVCDQYRFDAPWNGPFNAALAYARPWVYYCVGDRKSLEPGSLAANYFAVTGPGTVWTERPSERPSQAQEPNRILVMEAAGTGIHWMEPKDLTIDELLAKAGSESGIQFPGNHREHGVRAALTDGSVIFIPKRIPPDLLRTLLTEGIDDTSRAKLMESLHAEQEDKPRYLGFRVLAWAVSVLMLAIHVGWRKRSGTGPSTP